MEKQFTLEEVIEIIDARLEHVEGMIDRHEGKGRGNSVMVTRLLGGVDQLEKLREEFSPSLES